MRTPIAAANAPIGVRAFVVVAALAVASPLPWTVSRFAWMGDELAVIAFGAAAVAAVVAAAWALRSWSATAIVGSVANLPWFLSLVWDPSAAAPWLGLFLLAPYAAFTTAGCVGWFRDRGSRLRGWAIVLPPLVYAVPFVVNAMLPVRIGAP